MKWICFFSFLFLFTSCRAQQDTASMQTNTDDNTLLWEISGNKLASPSYLYGTFHLLCRSDINFSSNMKKAVAQAKEVYMELDMDDPSVLFGAMLLMNMKEGKQLKDLFSPEEYARLTHFFKDSLHMSLGMFQTMKPVFLESLLYPKMLPCKTTSGVEEELIKLAKQNKKEIQGLETMAFQASVFDSIPYEEQAKELLKTIDSLAAYRRYFDTMITVYKTQQLKAINDMFSKTEFGMDEHQDILLDNRNKNWIGQLKAIMKKEPVFVAVGAGHLVGEKGLIALLKKEGYVLRPIANK
ncbi:MAG: TraB/GumN family protein [Ferruginibacter sp.]